MPRSTSPDASDTVDLPALLADLHALPVEAVPRDVLIVRTSASTPRPPGVPGLAGQRASTRSAEPRSVDGASPKSRACQSPAAAPGARP